MMELSRQILDSFLEQGVHLEIGVANGLHTHMLVDAYKELRSEKEDNGAGSDFEDLFDEWGRKILAWWEFNIRNGSAVSHYSGDDMDGLLTVSYDRDGDQAELTVHVINGSINSPQITDKGKGRDGRAREWKIVFNDSLQSIQEEVWDEDPEGRIPATRETNGLFHTHSSHQYNTPRRKPVSTTP